MEMWDVIVVGGGPGGLAAATAAKKNGCEKVLVIERETKAGGILNQCIHNGFGLIRYKEELAGTEYATRAIDEALEAGVEIWVSAQVTEITDKTVTVVSAEGFKKLNAKAIVLATGCRERTRGAISIPGSRPAGIYTAGVAQNLVNIRNIMVGKKVVIYGSGDIGLIMARRLTCEGSKVECVVEIMKEPSGLARNISQCLYDFDIPLYCSTAITNIIGKNRVEAVEITQVDENGQYIEETRRVIECDTLVLSVGLIPENEVAEAAGVTVDSRNCVVTDEYLQTSVPGIFSCGNSRRVMDLADYVSMQGEVAGKNAALYIRGEEMTAWADDKANAMKKGLPAKNSITCVLCPNGCQVTWDENDNYSGNKCPRGANFAQQERKEPRRTITTSILEDEATDVLYSVKTKTPVPKDKYFDVLAGIKANNSTVVLDNGEEVEIVRTSK